MAQWPGARILGKPRDPESQAFSASKRQNFLRSGAARLRSTTKHYQKRAAGGAFQLESRIRRPGGLESGIPESAAGATTSAV